MIIIKENHPRESGRDVAGQCLIQILDHARAFDATAPADLMEAALAEISTDPKWVAVRSGWTSVNTLMEACEYQLLLLDDGYASVRVVGEVGRNGKPDTAVLQYTDSVTPWTNFPLADEEEELLLEYAGHFEF